MVLLTTAIAFCAVISCVLTIISIRESRKIEIERQRPYIVLSTVEDAPSYGVVLENKGLTCAYDVVVDSVPKIGRWYGGKFAPIGFLNETVACIPPASPLKSYIAFWHDIEEYIPNMKFTGTVSYRDIAGRKYKERFVVDFGIYEGIALSGKKGLHHIASEIEKMVKQLSSGTIKIKEVSGQA